LTTLGHALNYRLAKFSASISYEIFSQLKQVLLLALHLKLESPVSNIRWFTPKPCKSYQGQLDRFAFRARLRAGQSMVWILNTKIGLILVGYLFLIFV